MPDVKDVIKSLETAVKNFERYSGDEYGREYDYTRVGVDVLENALALLKAQEPRVMTLEEVRDLAGNHEIVWAENNGCKHCCEGYCSPDLYYQTKEVILWALGIEDEYEPNNALYGKSWRCWTSRPDEATREAIPWN